MNEIAVLSQDIIASLVINGDMKKLTPQQKVAYYNHRCHLAGLDPAAKPFDLLMLNGKEILYANAAGCQQLCSVHKLTTQVTSREKVDNVYCVCARVTGPDGRSSENMGTVSLYAKGKDDRGTFETDQPARGEELANLMMKATTKAIRRTVLSHLGLGMMEESEVETVPGAQRAAMPTIDVPVATNKGFENNVANNIGNVAQGLPAGLTSFAASKGIPTMGPGGFPLRMPNLTTGQTKDFAHYPNLIEWENAYTDLMHRCENSEKLSPDGKTAMKMALHQANLDVLDRIIQIEKDNADTPDI